MDKIKKIREERKLSQDDLAKRLGVTRAVISQYETGKRQPKLDQLKKIAAALNCSYLDLIGEGEPFKQWLDNVLSSLVTKGEIASYKRIDDSRLDLVLYDDNDKNIKHSYLINTSWFNHPYEQHMEDARNDVLKIINDFIKF